MGWSFHPRACARVVSKVRGRSPSYLPESLERRLCLSGVSPTGTGHVLHPGDTVQGTLSAPGESDLYSFEAVAGERYRVALGDTSNPPFGYLPRLQLIPPTGGPSTVLPGRDSDFVVAAGAGGTWVILVEDNNRSETGPYAFGLDRLDPLPGDAVTILPGQARSGELDSGEIETFAFQARAGDVLGIDLADLNNPPFGYVAVAEVRRPGGDLITTVPAGELYTLRVTADGTYSIRVHDNTFAETGPIAVGLDLLNGLPDASPLLLTGMSCAGTLESGDSDAFGFELHSGDLVRVGLSNSNNAPFGYVIVADLRSPSGDLIRSIDAGAQYELRAAVDGLYTLHVHDKGYAQTGGYAVGLDGLSPASRDARAMRGGMAFTGSLDQASIKAYTFHADAGDRVSIALADTSNRPFGYVPVAELRDPAGVLVGTRVDPGQRKDFVLAQGGTYSVHVYEDSFWETGPYSVSVDWFTPLEGSISGNVFLDRNGDGDPGATEPPLAGWTVFLDDNGNGVLDAAEPRTTSDVAGNYALTSVAPGAHHLREVEPAGWARTAPAAGERVVTVNLGQNVTGMDFGNRMAGVVGRQVFYNNSAADGNNPAADAQDDAAIAADKSALLPGLPASFANVTTSSKGINGIMVDLPALPAGANPGADDFLFSVGRDDPADCPAWKAAAPPASVTLRRGAGAGGSDRVTVTFADGSVRDTWLQVAVLPSADTGLGAPDVFYFGNLVGEVGGTGNSLVVNAVDLSGIRAAQLTTDPAKVRQYDMNHDGRVNAVDLGIARQQQLKTLSLLTLPSYPARGPLMPLSAGAAGGVLKEEDA